MSALTPPARLGRLQGTVRRKGCGQAGQGAAAGAQAGTGAWRGDGFTLVELLVVAAVLGLGALMLAPAVARTRPVSKAFLCRNNLKQLTAAWRTYADDNNDVLVASSSGISGRPTWITGYIDYNPANTSNWDVSRDITNSPLWAYIGRDQTRFKCPADASYVTVNGVRRARLRSVSMSHAFGLGEWLDQTYNPYQSRWRTYAKGADIMLPAKTFLFIDEHPDSLNDGAFANSCTGADQPSTARIIDFPASYHDNGACGISFADGRAETHKWKDPRTKPLVGYGNGLPLNVASPNNPDIAWLAQNTTVRR